MPTPNENTSDLHIAAHKGDVKMITALVAAGANVNTLNQDGETPVYIAAENDHADAIIALKAAGANVDMATQPSVASLIRKGQSSATPLGIAARLGHIAAISALIAAGANLEIKMSGQLTALMLAVMGGHSMAIAILILSGAGTAEASSRMRSLTSSRMGSLNGLLEEGLAAIQSTYQLRGEEIVEVIQKMIPSTLLELIMSFDCPSTFEHFSSHMLTELKKRIPCRMLPAVSNEREEREALNAALIFRCRANSSISASDNLNDKKQIYTFPNLNKEQLDLLIAKGAIIIGDLPDRLGVQLAMESSKLIKDLREKTGVHRIAIKKTKLSDQQLSYLKEKMLMVTIESEGNNERWIITAPQKYFAQIEKVIMNFNQINDSEKLAGNRKKFTTSN